MEKYMTKKSGARFKEKVRLESGQMMTKTFRTKTQAKQWKMKVETEKNQGLLGFKKKHPTPFNKVAMLWFETNVEHVLSAKTVINYRSNLQGKVIPRFGGLDIAKINQAKIEEFRNQLISQGLNPKTVNKVMTMVRQILLFAVDRGILDRSPLGRTLLLKTHSRQITFYEEEEVRRMLSARDSLIWPIVYLAAHTGMRLGEVLGLCWDKVNFTANRIEIARTLSIRRTLKDTTKSGRVRSFPMTNDLKVFFQRLLKKQVGAKFVFVDENGCSFNPDHFCQRYFKRFCKELQIRELRFHDLRHTYASHFMMSGGSVFELKELLGHSSIDMTMIYSHLSPKHLEVASKLVRYGL